MNFKKCSIDDLPLLCDIAEKTYRDTFAAQNTKSDLDKYVQEAFSPQRITQELNNPDSAFFFALKDGQAAGYIKLNQAAAQTDLNDANSVEIQRIYVLEDFQGQGYGQALLDFAVDYAKAKSFIWLGVWEKNSKAIRFYEKNGFYIFGSHPFLFGEDMQLDYLMRKDF